MFHGDFASQPPILVVDKQRIPVDSRFYGPIIFNRAENLYVGYKILTAQLNPNKQGQHYEEVPQAV